MGQDNDKNRMGHFYRLHTDALDVSTLQAIADRILERNPNQEVYIYPVDFSSFLSETNKAELLHKAHDPDCGCGQCSGEDRAIEAMEKGIVDAETDYGDR
jgi:hypothetical protein